MTTRLAERALPAACGELAAAVDQDLHVFLRRRREGTVAGDRDTGRLFDELERVVASGGKRLRPIFCLLGHLAAGGEADPRAVRAAASLELLHTFAIVHDDVMDRSRRRRGQPVSWAHLAARHRTEGMRGDPEGYGVSAAILVGDLALILADEALLSSGFPPERLLPAFRRYDRMRAEMVAGQYLDVLAAHRGDVGEATARRVALMKSGAYTVEGPLQIGALLAGAGPSLLALLSRYGVPLGEAFQLRDDVLGVFGDPHATGKDRDADLREGKRTVLVARALEAAPAGDRDFLEDTLGHPNAAPQEVARMRAIIESSGALAATLALVEELAGRAREAVAGEDLPGEVADLLAELAEALALRPD